MAQLYLSIGQLAMAKNYRYSKDMVMGRTSILSQACCL